LAEEARRAAKGRKSRPPPEAPRSSEDNWMDDQSLDDACTDEYFFKSILGRMDEQGIHVTQGGRLVDPDDRGEIDGSALRKSMGRLGFQVSERRCQRLINDYNLSPGAAIPTKVFTGLLRGQAQKLGFGPWRREGAIEARGYDRNGPEERSLIDDSMEERMREKTLLKQAKLLLDQESPTERGERLGWEDGLLAHLRESLFEGSSRMNDMYSRLDFTKSGTVNFREFQYAFKRAGIAEISQEAAVLMLLRFDRDGDGRMQKHELIRLLQNTKEPTATPKPRAVPFLGKSRLEEKLQRDIDRVGDAIHGVSIGDRVNTDKGCLGTVRYTGAVAFSTGEWVGLELDQPCGKHDGVVKGRRYFSAGENTGLFVRAANFW